MAELVISARSCSWYAFSAEITGVEESCVDARVGHQVGLELGDVNVERTVEAEDAVRRGSLADEAVEVGVGGAVSRTCGRCGMASLSIMVAAVW